MSTTFAERAADKAAANETGTAVEKSGKTIFDLIRDQQAGFSKALPASITAERFVRIAITSVRTNPKLAKCEPMSLLGALTLAAQLGLEPGGPLGHAYLVPFGREVTFIVGYKGLINLARRGGDIADIYAEPVYEGDEFSWSLGLHRDITHQPTAADRDDPTKVTHVYAVAKYRDGSDPSFIVLTRAQVEGFRARSKAAKNGPWVTDWTAMALKTGIRRLSTWLPLSAEVARALAADEQPISRIDVNVDDFIDIDAIDDEGQPLPDAETGDGTEMGAAANVDPPRTDGDGAPEAARLLEAQDLYREVVKNDHKAWKEFAGNHDIPTDSREWSAAQTEQVITWITAEPEKS